MNLSQPRLAKHPTERILLSIYLGIISSFLAALGFVFIVGVIEIFISLAGNLIRAAAAVFLISIPCLSYLTYKYIRKIQAENAARRAMESEHADTLPQQDPPALPEIIEDWSVMSNQEKIAATAARVIALCWFLGVCGLIDALLTHKPLGAPVGALFTLTILFYMLNAWLEGEQHKRARLTETPTP